MILNPLALKLKRQAKGDFRVRHFEATLIVQAVPWYLRYALSYRGIEEMLLERAWRWITPRSIAGCSPVRPPSSSASAGSANRTAALCRRRVNDGSPALRVMPRKRDPACRPRVWIRVGGRSGPPHAEALAPLHPTLVTRRRRRRRIRTRARQRAGGAALYGVLLPGLLPPIG